MVDFDAVAIGHLRELAERVKIGGLLRLAGFGGSSGFSASENTFKPQTAMMFRQSRGNGVEKPFRAAMDGGCAAGRSDKDHAAALLMARRSRICHRSLVTGGRCPQWFISWVKRVGSGTHLWEISEAVKAEEMSQETSSRPKPRLFAARRGPATPWDCLHHGLMAEALGMALSGNAGIPAVDKPPPAFMAQMPGRRIESTWSKDDPSNLPM